MRYNQLEWSNRLETIYDLPVEAAPLKEYLRENDYDKFIDMEDPEFKGLKIARFYIKFGEENYNYLEIDERFAENYFESDVRDFSYVAE